jgi:zinc transporter 1
VEVLVMLIGAVFLASLCFSLVVEAVQTLFHIGHIDEMHHPVPVMAVGALGLLLNGLCYVLIGGACLCVVQLLTRLC